MKITKVPKKYSDMTLAEYKAYIQEGKEIDAAIRFGKTFKMYKDQPTKPEETGRNR